MMTPCRTPKAKANQNTFLLLILVLLFFFFLLSLVFLLFIVRSVQSVDVVFELRPRVGLRAGSLHASPLFER
jgi:hypothetical protein